MKRSPFPLHPLLLGLYPVLALYLLNIEETPPYATLRSLAFTGIVLAVILAASLLLFRSLHKSALAASLLILLFFTYGHVLNVLENAEWGQFVGRHRVLLPLWTLLVLGSLIWIRRLKRDLQPITRTLNITAALLVLMTAAQIGWQAAGRLAQPRTAQPLPAAPPADSGQSRPDVYYIILDAYSRSDVLAQKYKVDNSAFLEELEKMGFYIARCAQSNYPRTRYSLASSLNMNYLDQMNIPNYPNAGSDDFEPFIKHGQVRQNFESLGYATVTFKTVYPYLDTTDTTYYYDLYQSDSAYDKIETLNFYYIFLRTTALRPAVELGEAADTQKGKPGALTSLIQKVLPSENSINNRNYRQYKQNLYLLDQLEAMPDLPGPKFVYAHLFLTHQPFTFTPDGQFRWPVVENAQAYRDQVLYANARIPQVIRTILKKSELPPVIIIQSDHGFPQDKQRVKILNAYYLPGKARERLYPGITPVNSFRIVFSEYFGQDYPLLKDTSYYVPNRNKVQEFEVVPASCPGE